jgi:N,N'-diacetyllegionaminate synthase
MKIEIIAELAQGFEGRPEQARLLMKAAAAAGADAAKYQLVYADELATPDYKHYDLFRLLEMSDGVWKELLDYAKELGIRLYVDIFGTRSLELSERIGIQAVKLHGTDIGNIGLLKEVANSSVPRVLLGAGGAFLSELERSIEILSSKAVIVLLGFQGYPTPTATNQISRVRFLNERFGRSHPDVMVGFADHAPPDSPLRYGLAATAIGAGARVLEKHLTLGQVMKLEDHESALNPDEFSEFCRVARDCALAYGQGNERPDFGMSEAETGYRKMIRRHVVVRHDLAAGTRLTPADLVLKRSSSENVLTDLDLAYDKILTRDLEKNSPIGANDIAE